MGRFLSIFLLSASFASGSVWAATIGQVSAYSAANKPLRMDIELVDLQGARIGDVLMRVADEVDHERFGLQRPAWADGSFARVLNKDSDSFVARLSSTRSVSDSTVDFVVELRAGSAVTWHKVSASLGSGSPLVAAPVEPKSVTPRPAASTAVVPQPMIEQPAPAPAPAPEAAQVVDEGLIADDIGSDNTSLVTEAEMMVEPVFDEPNAIADTSDMTATETTEADAESKLKPHQYFNRALILFFILCFVIAGLIGKVVKKIRKS